MPSWKLLHNFFSKHSKLQNFLDEINFSLFYNARKHLKISSQVCPYSVATTDTLLDLLDDIKVSLFS